MIILFFLQLLLKVAESCTGGSPDPTTVATTTDSTPSFTDPFHDDTAYPKLNIVSNTSYPNCIAYFKNCFYTYVDKKSLLISEKLYLEYSASSEGIYGDYGMLPIQRFKMLEFKGSYMGFYKVSQYSSTYVLVNISKRFHLVSRLHSSPKWVPTVMNSNSKTKAIGYRPTI